MFDQVNGTVTTGAGGTIDVTIAAATRADGLALLGLDASSVQVTVTLSARDALRRNLRAQRRHRTSTAGTNG
jgi:hypothetical protein